MTGEQLQHQHNDAFSPRSAQLSCITHRHCTAQTPEVWVSSQNDTIDSERRIIFVTDKEPVPCQATQQGTRSRTPAGGLGLFRERAFKQGSLQHRAHAGTLHPLKTRR